jgi:hypothetical protein
VNRFSPHYQVKQLLGFVTSTNGTPWMVLATGDPKVWLFCQGFPEGSAGNRGCFVATGLQNPVAKSRLVDVVRKALQSGLNVDMRTDPPTIYTDRLRLQHVEVEDKKAAAKRRKIEASQQTTFFEIDDENEVNEDGCVVSYEDET